MKSRWFVLLAVVLGVGALAGAALSVSAPTSLQGTEELSGETDAVDTGVVVVYKTPDCGCCSLWAEHLEENGFQVDVRDVEDLAPVKERFKVPAHLASCHTALVDGYVVEGHVPADALQRFLQSERHSHAVGLAVPGMPIGSPGMEMPGRAAESYDVLLFDEAGELEVFERR